MAHVLKYYKELTNKDGSVTRLEIHRDNSDGLAWIAKEIGPVLQQLSLNLQGDTEDIDAPIVKTSLNMTFVDAPDHAQASARKCGDWDEFYTSDSTKWMVVLKAKRSGASSFSTLWSGYLTPDSYSEQLRYRGSVTFVARDNIGHMQDFPFDAEGDADGMISLYELVQAAWAKIESPMELLWRASEWLETGGVEAFNTIMNVSAFDGMNWYEAVEKALYSYGAVLRYIGGNEVMVTTLRYLPSYGGNIDRLQRIEPVFVTGAQRELIPAVRRIEESAEYQIEDMIAKPVQVDQFTGDTQKFQIQGNSVDFDGVAWPISQKESGQGWCNPDLSLFFNPSAYDFASEQGEDANSMFIACNLYQLESLFSAHYAEYSRYMLPKDVTWRMRVGAPYRIANATLYPSNYVVQECSVVVSVEQEGVTHYLQQSGEWGATKVRIKTGLEGTEFFLNIPVSAVFTSGQVLLKVQVHQILTTKVDDKNVPYPALVVPVYMTSINASYALCKRNNFNTNYSERNNVILSRDPELAPALNEVPFPEIIKNGIFYRSGGVILPAKKWSWNGSQEQHLALYNHLQLLCYHAKPFNVITGAIVNADLTRVNIIYEWHGAEHILISGSYDYLSGRIEGAVLREFSRYDDMWTGANFPPYEENSSTNVGGGSNGGTSGGGGGGGTGGSVDLTGYATEIWVQEWVNEQGYLKGVEGSAFISVSPDDIISLDVDPQGGLGATQQGLGIVGIPDEVLNDSLKTINGESIVGTGNIIIQGGGGGITNESDPIFKASPAAKITDEDIERWNTDNGADIVMDTEMSDTSENAVQNKVIKEYVDLHPRYETIEEIVPPENVEDFATKEWARQTFTEPSDFKTINGQSIVGEGDIELNGGKVTLDTEMSDESENGVQNKVIKAYVDGKVSDIDVANLINVTYEELISLMMYGKLIKGAKYRITDYVTTVEQEGVMSEEFRFDIIVTALDEWMVSEDAMATDGGNGTSHPVGGYIPAWKLKYSIIPMYPARFDWACYGNEYVVTEPDTGVKCRLSLLSSIYTENVDGEQYYCFFGNTGGFPIYAYSKVADPQAGDMLLIEGAEFPIEEVIPRKRGKGVIYEMTDEWGNSAPYDFKSIKFRAYGSPSTGYTFEPREGAYERWVYTFEGGDFEDTSLVGRVDLTHNPSSDNPNYFVRLRYAVYNNKIKYFPTRLKPLVLVGEIISQENEGGKVTLILDNQIHDNEFINCENLSSFVKSGSVLRNCKNVYMMPSSTYNTNIRIESLKGTSDNPIVIENLVTSEEYTTHIGKNSQGEVKIWNPADLV